MTGRLTHVRLLVSDFAGCYRFYRDVLGLSATFGSEDDGYADFDAGAVSIALFSADEMAVALGGAGLGRSSGDDVCLVLGVPDVDLAVAEMAARGAVFITAPTDRPEWGLRTVHLRDPEGTLIELYHSLAS